MERVKRAFGRDADLLVFEDRGGEVVVRGRGFLSDDVWRPLNELVRAELGGKYSPVERGWVIPKVGFEPTRTGIPRIDRKLEEMEGFHMVDLEMLTAPAVKLRRSMDEEYIEELATTIKEKGVLQPILARPRPGGGYEVVAGEQRYRAAIKAELREVPCVIRPMSDRAAFEASLIENLQRKDLTDYEVAKALQHLLETYPEEYPTQNVLAGKLGKSQSWVANHLRMLQLEKNVSRETLEQMTEFQARTLLSLPEEERRKVVNKIMAAEKIPSAREMGKNISREIVQKTGGPEETLKKSKDAAIARLREKGLLTEEQALQVSAFLEENPDSDLTTAILVKRGLNPEEFPIVKAAESEAGFEPATHEAKVEPRPWWAPLEKHVPENVILAVDRFADLKTAPKYRKTETLKKAVELAWQHVEEEGLAEQILYEAEYRSEETP